MKRIIWTLIAMTGLLRISFADAALQPFSEAVPALVKVSYAHDMGADASLEFKDGVVICRKSGTQAAKMVTIKPTLDQWIRFFREINTAKVYKWSNHYSSNSAARDGGFYWTIDIQVDGASFHSDGNSAFPLDGDLTEAQRGNSKNKSYDLFMEAVSHLIGEGFPSGA